MNAVWVTRSFLDYRIPVYQALSERFDHRVSVVFNADFVPDRCREKLISLLGSRARGLHGELAIKLGPQDGFANRGFRMPFQKGLIQAVLDEKPDLLISDGFFQWTYAPLWLRATQGIPHVMCYEKTCHTEKNAQWIRTRFRKTALHWIDAICCNGRLSGEYTQGLGFPAERITYGHMVADVEGMQQRAQKVTDTDIACITQRYRLRGLVYLYVGRLIPLKGLMELFAAWQRFMRDRDPDQVTLLLVGDGPQRQALESYVGTHALNNIRFTGAIDYDQLAPIYRSAHVFIIPTLEDNWSLVVPEAMACSLPVICSRYNGCWPELIQPENGWVFDPLDVNQTVQILNTCMNDRERLPEMGQQSARIAGRHTASHAADAIVRACDIAGSRHGRKPRQ